MVRPGERWKHRMQSRVAEQGLDGPEPVHEGHCDERQLVRLAFGEGGLDRVRGGTGADPVLGNDGFGNRLDIDDWNSDAGNSGGSRRRSNG